MARGEGSSLELHDDLKVPHPPAIHPQAICGKCPDVVYPITSLSGLARFRRTLPEPPTQKRAVHLGLQVASA